MAKNENQEKSTQKQVLEVPEKVGFGNRDCFLMTEALETKVIYAKFGKGDDEIIWAIEGIKKVDSEATVERGDRKIVINLSKPFEVRTYKAPRKAMDLTDREKKRLQGIIEAIAEAEIEQEDYSDEEVEQRVAGFPKIVKYDSDDEDESYYIKSPKEIWLHYYGFSNNATLLVTLTEAYLKAKGIGKESAEYVEKFENIVLVYV